MALQKTLLKKRLKYRHPLPPKTSFCDKTIGSRELIFECIKKCMNNLEFFQPNLRWSSGEFPLNCHVWRGMTLMADTNILESFGERANEATLMVILDSALVELAIPE